MTRVDGFSSSFASLRAFNRVSVCLSSNLPDFKRLKSSFRCQRVNSNRVVCLSVQTKSHCYDSGILYRIIRDNREGESIERWAPHTYRSFDVVGLKRWFATRILRVSSEWRRLLPSSSQPPPPPKHDFSLSKIYSNVTEYVICIFTLSSVSTHKCLYSTGTLLSLNTSGNK